MTRGRAASIAGAILLAGTVFAWNAVRQEREFRRLIAVGDAALTRDQTYEAIEAFSGALAFKRDSMLAHLKRGDSYRRRGELAAALRDLREAAALDPAATRALELLGDVNAAMGRYERAIEVYRRYLAIDDRAPQILYKLALAYYRNGQIVPAVEPIRK
jgi:tetratricopeptide (TPR) repeat protein